MNSTKELKNVTKAQKKTQKASKKQQLKQQQQQQPKLQPADNAISKNVKNAHLSTGGVAPASKLARSATTSPPTVPAHNHSNNNNIMQTNNNTAHQKPTATRPPAALLAPGCASRTILPGYENAPKFERSNSFSLRGKLSKLINSITGSKENLSKTEEEADMPYKFTRSRSMILLRRSNRRSFIEPQLEQLSEEAEKLSDITLPASPRKNSMEVPEFTLSQPVGNSSEAATDAVTRTPQRHNSQPMTSTPVGDACEQDEDADDEVKLRRKPSSISLAAGEGNGVPFNPIHHFQRRRSNTLLASFKNTFANLTTEKKREKLNPRWSASLQSLQAIDNMVSYENMSFIDYDKFHGYEKQLERQLSTLSLMDQQQQQQQQGDGPPLPSVYGDPPPYNKCNVAAPAVIAQSAYNSANSTVASLPTPQTVVRRRKTTAERKSARSSFNLDTDYEHNLDKPRNVYRDSLDSRKLERLNDFSRNSFILDDKHVADWLNLEDGSVGKRRAMCTHQHSAGDVVDAATGAIQVSPFRVMSNE